jgi:ABC-type multidrug transport system ATPase subunit
MTEIRIDRVSHHYGSHAALTDVRARVAAGRITCLLGPNGAGKSTLVHCIVGLITPTEGTITVDGETAGSRNACEQIGFVYDDLPLPVNLTGREALALLQSSHREWDVALVDQLTDLLGLGDALDRLVAEYSHGMKRKLQVIGSLGHRPTVWVLDEPFRGLDPVATSVLSHLITEFARAGTVLIATHDLLRAQQLADDVLVVDGGRLVGAGPLDHVLDGEVDLSRRYLVLTGLDAVVERTKGDIADLHLARDLVS